MSNLLRLRLGYGILGIDYVNKALAGAIDPAYILRAFGACVDRKVAIHPFIMIHEANGSYANLKIENNVSVSRNVFFDLSGPITIESNSSIGMRAMLFTHTDFRRSASLAELYPRQVKPIRLCHDSVVGAEAIILPGVTINSFSIVAAGAVVAADVPAYSLVAGNPARVVKRIEVTNH